MSVGERDPHSGHMTTGHEWNGIKELNTPVPRPVYIFLILTVLFSVGYWLLMPAWPLGVTYTKGLLGINDRAAVAEKIEQAVADRATWTTRIEREAFAEIQADPSLMFIVRETGRALFGDNCAVCHGTAATGRKGYPSLVDRSWLWGGSAEAVAETLRVGINAAHDETRVSQMPAFGRDQMLDRAAILNVTAFVRSLAEPSLATGKQAEAVALGKQVFEENCVACHGENATGNVELGAPDLTDGSWTHGGDRESIYRTIFDGRQGQMPNWDQRLSPLERKILTLYVLDLGAAER